jgi:hypothetical protein
MQAAAVLLDAERSRQMAYYRLLKLLYLADRDDEELGAMTHALPEYCAHHVRGTSKQIPLAAIIDSVGRTSDAEVILRDAEETAVLDGIFGG